jgi:hypothetical protein
MGRMELGHRGSYIEILGDGEERNGKARLME